LLVARFIVNSPRIGLRTALNGPTDDRAEKVGLFAEQIKMRRRLLG
jgi:hypothetical protein